MNVNKAKEKLDDRLSDFSMFGSESAYIPNLIKFRDESNEADRKTIKKRLIIFGMLIFWALIPILISLNNFSKYLEYNIIYLLFIGFLVFLVIRDYFQRKAFIKFRSEAVETKINNYYERIKREEEEGDY